MHFIPVLAHILKCVCEHMPVMQNCIRAGIYGSVLWGSAMLVLLVFTPGINKHSATIAMVAGLVPVGGLFALAAWLRLRYFVVIVANRIRCVCTRVCVCVYCACMIPWLGSAIIASSFIAIFVQPPFAVF